MASICYVVRGIYAISCVCASESVMRMYTVYSSANLRIYAYAKVYQQTAFFLCVSVCVCVCLLNSYAKQKAIRKSQTHLVQDGSVRAICVFCVPPPPILPHFTFRAPQRTQTHTHKPPHRLEVDLVRSAPVLWLLPDYTQTIWTASPFLRAPPPV